MAWVRLLVAPAIGRPALAIEPDELLLNPLALPYEFDVPWALDHMLVLKLNCYAMAGAEISSVVVATMQ